MNAAETKATLTKSMVELKAYIEEIIGPLTEVYFSGLDGLEGYNSSCCKAAPNNSDNSEDLELDLVTICILQTRNGYKTVGTYVYPDSEHYDWEESKKFALNDALTKISENVLFLRREIKYQIHQKNLKLQHDRDMDLARDEPMDSSE